MNLQIDNRETKLIHLLQTQEIKFEIKQLPLGDIIFLLEDQPKLILERKTISDLSQSIKDGRYHNQKDRLMEYAKETGCLIAYLLELGDSQSIQEACSHFGNMAESLYSAIVSSTLRDAIPTFYCKDLQEAIRLILKLRQGKFLQEKKIFLGGAKPSAKSNQININNAFLYFLIQIPRISPSIAQKIVNQYPRPINLIRAYESLSTEIEKEKLLTNLNGIGKIISSNVYQFFGKDS